MNQIGLWSHLDPTLPPLSMVSVRQYLQHLATSTTLLRPSWTERKMSRGCWGAVCCRHGLVFWSWHWKIIHHAAYSDCKFWHQCQHGSSWFIMVQHVHNFHGVKDTVLEVTRSHEKSVQALVASQQWLGLFEISYIFGKLHLNTGYLSNLCLTRSYIYIYIISFNIIPMVPTWGL